MPVGRIFSDEELQPGTVRLDDEEVRHLVRVLRAKPGDPIELVNGRGVLADGSVRTVGRNWVDIDIETVTSQLPRTPQLLLYQALPRLNRLDTILEKATELGVHQIHLFPGERSEVPRFNAQAQRRADAILRAALKQCGRLDLPQLEQAGPISSWTQLPKVSYFGDLRPDTPSLRTAFTPSAQVAFITGPESGLTPSEIAHLESLSASGVTLHPNTLRTDTASIAALSIISHLLWA